MKSGTRVIKTRPTKQLKKLEVPELQSHYN